jgi:phosphatidylinositol 4-kinase B
MDMQIRLQRTKQDWSSRLEDFGHRMVALQQQQAQQGSNGTTNVSTTPSSLSPFRVLLQLFAYEDVLENRKLDTLFDVDDGAALTFYVPQLLSFLLHGALYTSPALEEWILKKCTKNIYFAHKCYWYLRAWCLEVPAESRPITPSISRRNSATSLSSNNLTNGAIGTILSQQQQNQSNEGLLPFLDEPAVLEKTQFSSGANKNVRNSCLPGTGGGVNASHAVTVNGHGDLRTSSVVLPNGVVVPSPSAEKDKFLIPEERAMIERFMMRVKECGQIPAYALEYGMMTTTGQNNGQSGDCTTSSIPLVEKTNVKLVSDTISYEPVDSCDRPRNGLTYRGGHCTSNGNTSTSAMVRPLVLSTDACNDDDHFVDDGNKSSSCTVMMAAAAESGKIPVDPTTGKPSTSHFNALFLHQPSIGFRSSQQQHSTHATNNSALSSLRRSETEQFDKTPQFLDALIFLAENLFYIPREKRRETLRQQLQSLECELLPCNSIYLPIGNMNQYHRVWRIVAEESIAISTKERVPCIVALEVIDFASSSNPTSKLTDCGYGRSVEGTLIENSSSNHSSSSPPPISVTQHGPNDTELVAEWRYGYRNPLRHVPFLDKVTTSVKVPFVKMKTQVRDHFNQLRDRGVSEEMQALSSADVLVENHVQATKNSDPVNLLVVDSRALNGSEFVADKIAMQSDQNTVLSQAENGAVGIAVDEPSRSLLRMNSAGSIVSLGQWSSPAALSRTISDADKQAQLNLNDVRACLDSELPDRNRKSSPLLYGSDQEDDPSERELKALSWRPPSGRRSFSTTIIKEGNMKETRPPPVVFRESWVAKQERVRQKSAFGDHPGWKLLAILIKGNDDLRQEQLAAQLIQRMATILACEKVNVWLCPYQIIATTDRGGVIEAIPDTISIDSLKKNDPNYTTLNDFFLSHYGEDTEELAGAKANFVESLAAYSMVCFILQLKDRHNGNILLDKWGHIIHIDFGFFFLSSPGKNAGFESAPFKLTRDFVELLEGTNSHLFRTFRDLCIKTFIALRRRCMEIILLVEMLKNGNEDLKCFRGRPEDAIQQLRDRFRLDLNDRACKEYVNCLIDDSIENWRTDWYDRYQRYCVGVF